MSLRAHANHLMVNCEREPDSNRRFAGLDLFRMGRMGRICMMVVDLERRGYHGKRRNALMAGLSTRERCVAGISPAKKGVICAGVTKQVDTINIMAGSYGVC